MEHRSSLYHTNSYDSRDAIISATAETDQDYFGKVVVTFKFLGSADRYSTVHNTVLSAVTADFMLDPPASTQAVISYNNSRSTSVLDCYVLWSKATYAKTNSYWASKQAIFTEPITLIL